MLCFVCWHWYLHKRLRKQSEATRTGNNAHVAGRLVHVTVRREGRNRAQHVCRAYFHVGVQPRVECFRRNADSHANLLEWTNPLLTSGGNAHHGPLHAPCGREQENTWSRGAGGSGVRKYSDFQLVEHRMRQSVLQGLGEPKLLGNC